MPFLWLGITIGFAGHCSLPQIDTRNVVYMNVIFPSCFLHFHSGLTDALLIISIILFHHLPPQWFGTNSYLPIIWWKCTSFGIFFCRFSIKFFKIWINLGFARALVYLANSVKKTEKKQNFIVCHKAMGRYHTGNKNLQAGKKYSLVKVKYK